MTLTFKEKKELIKEGIEQLKWLSKACPDIKSDCLIRIKNYKLLEKNLTLNRGGK